MGVLRLSVLTFMLTGCAAEQELWTRPVSVTQAQLDQAYAACQVTALQTPEIHTQTDVYTSHVTTIGNQTTVTTGPDPYAQFGNALSDAIDNDQRKTEIRRWCMASKGFVFAGTRAVSQ